MSKLTINVGAVPDSGTGDALRNAMIKVNSNFSELYTKTATLESQVYVSTVAGKSGDVVLGVGDVSGLQLALDDKAAAIHTHTISDVSGLQSSLDGKQAAGSYAAASHTHQSVDISDATAANTSNKIIKRDASGSFSATVVSADLSGNASTASKLAAARSISLTGSVSGSASFDGSQNVSIVTESHYPKPIQSYGAIGNGVADDTAAFYNAGTAGGTIFVGKGSYNITTDLAQAKTTTWLITDEASFTGAGTGLPIEAYDFETAYMAVHVSHDDKDREAAGGSKVSGFLVDQRCGGGTGGRHGIYGRLVHTEPNTAASSDHNYVGIQGHTISVIGDGGTDSTMTGSRGAYFALSGLAYAGPAATNVMNLTGAEFNTYAAAGSSVAYISGVQIATMDEIQGTVYDCALSISRAGANASVGKKHGILFGPMNGHHPVATTGTIMGSTGPATSVDTIFDFQNVTSSSILKTATFTITPTGMEMGSLSTAGNFHLDFHSSGHNIDYDARIIATGGTATVGQGALTLQTGVTVFDSPVIRPQYDATTQLGSSAQRFSSTYSEKIYFGAGNVFLTSGTGSPEGVVTAPVGSMYTRTDGGANTTFYVKQSGTGNTGWAAK